MRTKLFFLSLLGLLSTAAAHAQGTVPVFQHSFGANTVTLAGADPTHGQTTHIPVTLVPVRLSFPGVRPVALDASQDVPALLASPVFTRFAFPSGGDTQYTDALLRTTFGAPATGHTLLEKPAVKAVTIEVPAGYGYVLTSKQNGGAIAVVDMQYVQRELFKQLPKQDGLVLALTHNATFYAEGDDTICCTTGTHGVDKATGTSFVLGSYFAHTPAIVKERDLQPLTQQLAEFFNDPLHDPLAPGNKPSGNVFVSPWAMPSGGCGGRGIGSEYFLLQPTNTNHKNNFPVSSFFIAKTYHLSNVALLPWYGGAAATDAMYSFPDKSALTAPAETCGPRHYYNDSSSGATAPKVAAIANDSTSAHKLIGYWNGGHGFLLHDVSPQWDIIIEAFASPDHSKPEGTLRFNPPQGYTPNQLKADIAAMQARGKKVMISLGGGGAFYPLTTPASEQVFIDSVTQIIAQYGFNGVDIDFESPSMDIDAGDRDFRSPTTPSVVHLIDGLHKLRQHFGSAFMISLVPEGSQMAGGFPAYGGQFGSYLALTYGLRDILTFVDMQDYNTPPLQGLDGEVYQSATTNYHAAMTELFLHGFPVGGDSKLFFPPVPANKLAVGFLTGYEEPATMHNGIDYLVTGKKPADATYRLMKPTGYPNLLGGMYWTIDADRREDYKYSNNIGPLLHGYPGKP